MEKFLQFLRDGWMVTFICLIFAAVIIVELRNKNEVEPVRPDSQTVELLAKILKIEQEQGELKKQISSIQQEIGLSPDEFSTIEDLKIRAGLTALEGSGVIVRMDDSNANYNTGENSNLYVIHDEDILRIVNELRAAGAEAISINGQRLIATSEIRCAGPTLSVNNVRSAPPFEIIAIGDRNTLENSIKMRGGVKDALKVWGIQIEVQNLENVYIPPYSGNFRHVYAKVVDEKTP